MLNAQVARNSGIRHWAFSIDSQTVLFSSLSVDDPERPDVHRPIIPAGPQRVRSKGEADAASEIGWLTSLTVMSELRVVVCG